MSPYTPEDRFPEPQIYDLSDLVKGGFEGDANAPIKDLYDQASYVKHRLSRWDDVMIVTGNYSFDVESDIRKLLLFKISDNRALVLPDPGEMLPGMRLPIVSAIAGIKSLTIQSPKPILDGSTSWVSWQDASSPAIYMHDGEKLILVAGSDAWYVETANGNFYNYGEDYAGRIQGKNSLIANGTTYQRTDVPRLALFINKAGPGIVDDAIWLSNPGGVPVYRGCYSKGNGTTTLRVPDERGMSVRHLDLGRGVDNSRLYPNPGGYESDQVGAFGFTLLIPKGDTYNGNPYDSGRVGRGQDSNPRGNLEINGGFNAGKETIVKNIGKIPLIRY